MNIRHASGDLKSNNKKFWMIGMLFSSHWKWLRTVRRNVFFMGVNIELILSATTWMNLTSDAGAWDKKRNAMTFKLAIIKQNISREQITRTLVEREKGKYLTYSLM